MTGFSFRISAFYAAVFFGVGIHLPFMPVWLSSKGLGAWEISLVLASQIAVRIVASPIVAYMADRYADRRLPLRLLAAGTLGGVVVWSWGEGFWQIFLLGVAASIFWTPIIPLIDSFAVAGSRRHALNYGRMRLWGSLSFVAASFTGGLVLKMTVPASVMWLLIGAEAMLLVTALALPRDTLAPGGGEAGAGARMPVREIATLLRERSFLLLVCASSLVQATHAVYYAFATLHWQSLSLGEDMIGVLWAIAVVAEILLFAMSAPLLRRLGPAGLIAAGAISAVARWSVLAFDPPLWLLVPAQIAHAGSFAATFLGTVQFIGQRVPHHLQTTAQGIYAAVAGGILMGTGLLAAGPLYGALGAYSYLVMAAVGLGGVFFAIWLWLLAPGNHGH